MQAIFYAYACAYRAHEQAEDQVAGFLSPLYCRAGAQRQFKSGFGVLPYQVVVTGVEVACPAAKLKGEAGPERCILSSGIKVPARTTTGLPDGFLHPLLHFVVECLLSFRLHFDGLQLASPRHSQAVQDIVDLRFNDKNQAGMSNSG